MRASHSTPEILTILLENLSTKVRSKISLDTLKHILQIKNAYYQNLSYQDKLFMNSMSVARSIYQKMKKKHIGLGPSSIQKILMAEEVSFYKLNQIFG